MLLNKLIKKQKTIYFLFLIMPIISFGKYPKETKRITAKQAFKLGPDIISKIQPVPNVKSYCSILLDNKQIITGYAPIEDGQLYYEIEGNGIPIILLNPGPGGTHHYFHPYFSDAAKFAQVIYYDMRGTGQSSKANNLSQYSIKQAIKDLEDLRKFLKIDKWIVLGWSFGGFLAECYSLIHPENILGLILVAADTAGFNKTDFGESRVLKYLHKEEQEKISDILSITNLKEDEIIYNLNLNGDWKRQCFYKPSIDEIARIALYEWKHDPNFRKIISFDKSRILFNKKFDIFDIPTLIIEGAKDLSFSKNKAKLFIQLHPKAKSITFKKAGHKIFEDEQINFFIELEKFINAIKENKITVTKKAFSLPENNSLIYEIETNINSLNKLETEELFEKAKKTNLNDLTAWLILFYHLFKHKSYEQALFAIEKTIEADSEKNIWTFELLVWKGHTLDLLQRREQALICYTNSLQFVGDKSNDFFGDGIEINKKYAYKRLKEPFKI